MEGFYFLAAPMAVLLLLVGVVAIFYNRLVRSRILVREGFSGIDVQLKRRHDLIPNLLKIVEGYADFERGVLKDVTRLRTAAMGDLSVDEKQRDENALSDALVNLFAVVENYPVLKANDHFLNLQRQLTEIEDVLQKARRYYNGTVRDHNIRVQSFPSNIAAVVFGFRNAPFFELESIAERQPPQIKLNADKRE